MAAHPSYIRSHMVTVALTVTNRKKHISALLVK